MDEYISREAVVRYLEDYSNREACKPHPFSMIITSVLDKAKRVLSEMPATDVQPVRRGRWINRGDYSTCTVCGGSSGTQYDGVEPISKLTPYCPNCGARMDFKEENNYAK